MLSTTISYHESIQIQVSTTHFVCFSLILHFLSKKKDYIEYNIDKIVAAVSEK